MLCALLGTAANSRPAKDKFVNELTDRYLEQLGIDEMIPDSQNGKELKEHITNVARVFVNAKINIKDYIFFDVASMDTPEGMHNVAVGLYGSIISFGKEQGKQVQPYLEQIVKDIMGITNPALEDILEQSMKK